MLHSCASINHSLSASPPSRFAGPACVGGRLPADAVGDDPSGGGQPPALGQHVHLAALHPALLEQGHPQEQAAPGDQDEELRLRLTVKRQQRLKMKERRRRKDRKQTALLLDPTVAYLTLCKIHST